MGGCRLPNAGGRGAPDPGQALRSTIGDAKTSSVREKLRARFVLHPGARIVLHDVSHPERPQTRCDRAETCHLRSPHVQSRRGTQPADRAPFCAPSGAFCADEVQNVEIELVGDNFFKDHHRILGRKWALSACGTARNFPGPRRRVVTAPRANFVSEELRCSTWLARSASPHGVFVCRRTCRRLITSPSTPASAHERRGGRQGPLRRASRHFRHFRENAFFVLRACARASRAATCSQELTRVTTRAGLRARSALGPLSYSSAGFRGAQRHPWLTHVLAWRAGVRTRDAE